MSHLRLDPASLASLGARFAIDRVACAAGALTVGMAGRDLEARIEPGDLRATLRLGTLTVRVASLRVGEEGVEVAFSLGS